MELQSGPALRLTIFVKANDRWHHRPLYTEIVHRAHGRGSPGRASSTASKASASPR